LKAYKFIKDKITELHIPFNEIYYKTGDKETFILECFLGKKGSKIFVIGAHYDTVYGSPGADDNASGIALLLCLLELLKNETLSIELRVLFFPNEEPPYFGTDEMGSKVYVDNIIKRKENITLMISVESVGFYSEEKNSQTYPLPFMDLIYPKTGDFIGIVSDLKSRYWMRRLKSILKKHTKLKVESISAPPALVPGMDFSDHLPFWERGFKALMVTDTAFLRNPFYHTHKDLPHFLDYEKIEELLKGFVMFFKGLK
jgi:Zn-dependent M28 family amino/carboxypeptidase